jgi:L-aminopeptidase/D-esterase-like protein
MRLRRPAAIAALVLLSAARPAGLAAQQREADARMGAITDVPGILVGQVTLPGRPTGCTVVLAGEGATGGVDVRGGAPGTRETDLLDPVNSVELVHAVVLSGGSAFGLDAASGVMRLLEERGIGFPVGDLRVPIVTGAILFDLGVGDPSIRPDAACGYEAASIASAGPPAEGNAGAGAGASVGKIAGLARAMKGGIGTASIARSDGLVVGAIVAVNALGDVIDPATGEVVAGVRTADGRDLADARLLLRSGSDDTPGSDAIAPPPANTVIGVVATNARLTKAQATRVAQMAQDGLARTVSPAHTPWDGDTIFTLATGGLAAAADPLVVGGLAAEAIAEAILRAVRAAEGLEGLPAARDLRH